MPDSGMYALLIQALLAYFLVLWAHSLRLKFGPVHFYALLGALTAVMSWLTDASLRVQIAGITFMIGSTVFYTSLLLGVFVVYVFDGPALTRTAISIVVGVSILSPVIAAALHFQADLLGNTQIAMVPVPSLRINTASVIATLIDLVFLAIAWEYFGGPRLGIGLWLRTFFTLLGVMWLDVLLFSTGAFAGKEEYLSIMKGTLVSRLVISLFAFPFLYGYLRWQSGKKGMLIENRLLLAILKRVAEVEVRLSIAQQEIEARKAAERERDKLIEQLKQALSEVKTLRGFLPICSNCKKIRDDKGYWSALEAYIQEHSGARFSHGICPECAKKLYPDYYLDVTNDK